MKKLKHIVLLTLVGLAFSCNDAIDINQPGRLTADVAFRNVNDLRAGLLGVYRQLDATPEISLASNFTDEIAIGFDSGGQGTDVYDFVMNAASEGAADFWVRNFVVNNRATILINAATLVTPEASEQTLYNNILGQAYAIRAYANFELLYHISPDLTNDASLGIPVIDFIPALDIQPRRNTTGESFDYILSDLATADALMTTQADPVFASKDFITAMRARIAAARGDQVTAGNLAQQLLASYPIANRTQYQLMYLDADNTEIIFKMDRTRGDAQDRQGNTGLIGTGGGWAGARYAFVSATLAGSPYMEMDRGLFNLMDPADIRFTVNVAPTSVINPNYATDPDPVNTDILVIQKYPGSEGRPLMNDLKIFRSAEMLLILAESRAYAGNFNGASNSTAALIKQLRDARFGSAQPLPNYASQTAALAAVLDERRIELCFEGHRYRDLKRVGPDANKGVERDLTDCTTQSGACTLPATDHRFALPIPIVEINANPGIREQQNPGYN